MLGSDCANIYGRAAAMVAGYEPINEVPQYSAHSIYLYWRNCSHSNLGNHKGAGKGINWVRCQVPKPSQSKSVFPSI